MSTTDKQQKAHLGIRQEQVKITTNPPEGIEDFETNANQPQSAVIGLRGNAFFSDGCFKDAVESYTEALETTEGTKHPDPRLFINRATAYLKLESFEKCLQDSEAYINAMPNCWKGHTRKALALNGLGRELPSLSSAAIAYYRNTQCCRQYEPFQSVFKDRIGNWAVVDSSESLKDALRRNEKSSSSTTRNILLLQDGQYEISLVPRLMLDTSLVAISEVHGATLRTELLYLNNNCCFQNINIETKNGVLVPPQVTMEFYRCSFQCTSADRPAIQVGGTASFFECKISDSKGGGMIVGAGTNALASLVKCRVCQNGSKPKCSSGIRVFDNGSLVVQDCLIHGNTEGIHIYGSPKFVLAKEVKVTGSKIYDNQYEGIIVAGAPNVTAASVTIQENKIYQNGGYGVRVSLCVNDVRFHRNIVFENAWWGVWVQCNSGGHYKGNEICSNKMGGVRVGRQSPGKPPCVVENNAIHDNCGPAFHEELRYFEGYAFPSQLQDTIEKQYVEKHKKLLGLRQSGVDVGSDISLPSMVTTDFKSNNQCFKNGNERNQLQKTASTTKCVFCFRTDADLAFCKHCSTATYCGKECQTMHWGRHKYVCQAAGQRNFIDVFIPVGEPGAVQSRVSSIHPGLESVDPGSPPTPPRDGERFIVKMQTHDGSVNAQTFDSKGYASSDFNPEKATVVVYDRSRSLEFEISDRPKIYHLILEYGIVGASMYLSKKLYCWAAFKNDDTLRIFTREFPAVQKW